MKTLMLIVCSLLVVLTVRSAEAKGIVLFDGSSAEDVSDEAVSVTLMLRTAATRSAGWAVRSNQDKAPWTVRNAKKRLAESGEDFAVLFDVARDGTGLRCNVVVVAKDGTIEGSVVRSGDGDVRILAEGVAQFLGSATGSTLSGVPFASLGETRVLAQASRLWRAEGAKALPQVIALLGRADPLVALRVSAVRDIFAGLLKEPTLTPLQHATALRVLGSPSDLTVAAATAPAPYATILQVFAEGPLEQLAMLDKELSKAKKDSFAVLARAIIAHRRNTGAERDRLLLEALAGDGSDLALVWASSLPARSLSPTVHRSLLAALKKIKPDASGLRSRLALGAAEANVDRAKVLMLIDPRELDDAELGRLEPILAGGDERTTLRLKAEVAVRRNDDSAPSAIEQLVSTAPGESRGHLLRGRQLMAEALYKQAANEFAVAGAGIEQARALALAGDLNEAMRLVRSIQSNQGAELLVLQAALALEKGDIVEATRLADLAEALAPTNASLLATVVALDKSGESRDTLGVVATKFAPAKAAATTITATGTTTNDATNLVAGDPLVTALQSMIASIPALTNLPSRDIVVAPLESAVPWYGLRLTNPGVLQRALMEALRKPPSGLRIAKQLTEPFAEPIDRSTLKGIVGGHSAAVLYQLTPDGGSAKVRILVFQQGASEGQAVSRTLPSYGMVEFNLAKIIPLIAVVGILVLAILFVVVRGSGDIEVKYKLDADSKDEVFGIVIAKTSARPNIADLKKFHTETTKAGQKIERRKAILISGATKFRVPPGKWQVVLYGVYERGGDLMLLADSTVKSADVRRGKTSFLTFDLVAREAELRIAIIGNEQKGVAVWLNAGQANKVYTDKRGLAVLHCLPGSHVLYAEVNGKVFDRKLQIAAPRIERVSLNLERELKLAAVTGFDAGSLATPTSSQTLQTGEQQPFASATDLDGPIELGVLSDVVAPSIAAKAVEATASQRKPEVGKANAASGIDIGDLLGSSATAPAPDLVATPLSASATVSLGDSGGFFEAPVNAKPASGFFEAPATPSDSDNFFESPVRSKAKGSSPSGVLEKLRNKPQGASSSADRLLGRYEVRKELGRGAMGVVYRAWDCNLERDVAIKVLAKELRSHKDALRLFQQEAKALAQMNHGNIVSVYDQVTDGEEVFLILEFVDGTTLDALLTERQRFGWFEAAMIVDQLCAGLAYAHGRSVIHRDIKPANIFIAKDGQVKLGDFGLARIVREASIRKTEIRGTPLYMAPEQITGRDIDARADLYAVGCTFFELVTGRPPFIDGEILYMQLHEKPPVPQHLDSSIEPAISDLILDMIAKAADDRPSDANAVRARLRKILA